MITETLKKKVAARGQGGFTLIELLVVIAILAILAGVVVFAVGNSTENAGIAACKTERASIVTAWNAAVTANVVNADNGNSVETWLNYMPGGDTSLKYYAVPTATGATRTNTTNVTSTDCTAIADAELR